MVRRNNDANLRDRLDGFTLIELLIVMISGVVARTFVSDARSNTVSTRASAASTSKERCPKAWHQSGRCAVPTSTTAAGKALTVTARSSTCRAPANECATARAYRGPPAPAACTPDGASKTDANTPSAESSTAPVERL